MSDFIITTISGIQFDLGDPTPDMVSLADIARSLSNQARFAGHYGEGITYSIAEHAVRVAHEVHARGGSERECLRALHHDSHEAYITDIPTPVKRLIGRDVIEAAASKIDKAIFEKLGVSYRGDLRTLAQADEVLLRREAITLRPVGLGDPTRPDGLPLLDAGWQPGRAEKEFLLHHELFGGKVGLAALSPNTWGPEPMAVKDDQLSRAQAIPGYGINWALGGIPMDLVDDLPSLPINNPEDIA